MTLLIARGFSSVIMMFLDGSVKIDVYGSGDCIIWSIIFVYSSFMCYSLFLNPSNLWSILSHATDSHIFGFVVLQMCARRLWFPFNVCSSIVSFVSCLFRLCLIYHGVLVTCSWHYCLVWLCFSFFCYLLHDYTS